MEIFSGILLLILVGTATINGQSPPSATVNVTLNEIRNFKMSSIASLSRPFNNLRDDLYGHFFRSQTTLRLARQTLFSTASKFPYYQLNDTMRASLVKKLSTIINDCVDPTIDYVQKTSMLPFFDFATDASTPIEAGLSIVSTQLQDLTTAVQATSNSTCLKNQDVTSRRLSASYSAVIDAELACIRNASAEYRPPINEFTRVHFIALPYITRINTELLLCSNRNNTDSCVDEFLTKFCDDEARCKVCTTITTVKTQAETMVNTVQPLFKKCLEGASAKLPKAAPFLEKVQRCSTPEAEPLSDFIVEENSV